MNTSVPHGCARARPLRRALAQALPSALALMTLLGQASPALASCGAASCTLMTDRFAQGTAEHVGWSADMRLEAVTQDRLRSGTSNLTASQVTGEEVVERHTKNLNIVTTLGYGFSREWSLALRAPVVRRDHLHDLLDEDTGQPGEAEQWRFTRPGDVLLLARRHFAADADAPSFALFGGLKLPTGATDLRNEDGNLAERSLQPGSGTVDSVLGIAARHTLGLHDALIAQASTTWALNSHEGYKPGTRVEVSLGWSHAYSQALGVVLQANLRQRGRDSGVLAEPELSGGSAVDISPGLTFGVGSASTLYAYLQLPVYQKVNGVQLVARSALAIGWTADF